MTIRRLFLCAALAASMSACSKKDPMDKMVSMMEDLGNAVDDAKGDCGKMAEAVQGVADRYKSDVPAMKEAAQNAKKDKDKAKALMEKYGDRLQKVLPKVMA